MMTKTPYVLGSRPFTLLVYWILLLTLPLAYSKLDRYSSSPKAVRFLLSPFLVHDIISHLSLKLYITLLLSTLPWCLIANYVYQANRDTTSRMVHESAPSHRRFPGLAVTNLAWAVAVTLHLVLLTHFMTLKSIPEPDHRPRRGADERLAVRGWGRYITSTLWNICLV